VLITGGASPLGAALAKRLLADPAYDVRVSDARPAPRWMREGCEIHRGDLRLSGQASAAAKGCPHVIHLARFEAPASAAPWHTLLEYEAALHGAVLRAALDRGVERLLYVSSPRVFERAELFPTPEEHLEQCPAPDSARGFARLSGERLCMAAQQEHGLEFTICRPFGAYGPPAPHDTDPVEPEHDEQQPMHGPAADLSDLIERAIAGEQPLEILGSDKRTLTPTHIEDLADGILAALGSPAAANEDFNLAGTRELSLAEIATLARQAGGERADSLALRQLSSPTPEPERSHPSTQKARDLLGWEARIELEQGVAAIAEALAARAARGPIPATADA
jgi:nucleoside-diphosphate-sugar epimerase